MEIQSQEKIENWSKDQVVDWVNKSGFPEYSKLFYGDVLLTLSQEDFHMWLRDCKVAEIKRLELYWKIFQLKKYYIENQLLFMNFINNSIDDKDYTLASLSKQLQDVKGEIIGVKAMGKLANSSYDDSSKKFEYLSKGGELPHSRIHSRSRSIDETHAKIVSQASASHASSNSLSRMPSKLRTKKSPKTPSGTGSVFSPESAKSSPVPVKTPTLTEKQEQILKNAMELYGHKPSGSTSKSSKSKYGPSSSGTTSSSWFS